MLLLLWIIVNARLGVVMDIDFALVDRALASLHVALAQAPKNDLERDGVIQRFEYSFELVWKIGKRVLDEMGVKSHSPRSVIRDLAQQGFLIDGDAWMRILTARNYTSHTYNEDTARWVFSLCKPFLAAAEDLVSRLKAETAK